MSCCRYPFGTDACARYRRLHKPPILPHEELLCAEADQLVGAGRRLLNSLSLRQCALGLAVSVIVSLGAVSCACAVTCVGFRIFGGGRC